MCMPLGLRQNYIFSHKKATPSCIYPETGGSAANDAATASNVR